ncbi:multiple RNA-binding domain-containing protein 1-like isoform X1 [Primulina tabacum]|uniref:multiple RNA-binding domain-containing protein 1-like isoform X1 n=2 Tax=Primulina tabacum TaxID=48773 RepID=UPI003F5A5348
MSRICAKNLPKYVTEDRLREFFSRKGEVTDAKIMRTRDGKSRQFGFIGFRTENEAEEAIKYFNKSFLDTCRITCEVAWKIGDPDIPRPWSRHSKKQKENTTEADNGVIGFKGSKPAVLKEDSQNNEKGDENGDPQFQEFLEVMQPRSKSKLWANDALAASSLVQDEVASNSIVEMAEECERKLGVVGYDPEEMKGEGRNTSVEKQDVDKPKVLADDKVVSDMDYFRSRIKKDWSDSESSDDEVGDDHSDNDVCDGDAQTKRNNDPSENILEQDFSDREAGRGSFGEHKIIELASPLSFPTNENEEVLGSSRLFIRNLPYTATEEELEDHFTKYGSISEVHIVFDKDSKRSKGFAYILFALPESAARAMVEMDNAIFQGRLLHIIPAKPKNINGKQDDFDKHPSKTLKQQREEERKASEARGNTQAWNSLYMRPDTVVENIARKYGVSKSELLDRESDDLAVQIALGETQVIAETKKALSSAGVNIASLEEFASGRSDGLKRSNHAILVKNLPYSSSENELVNMFGKFGSLDKVILPPTKTLALVLFLEPAEARAAFRGLTYKRYKDVPLYLEWAPYNILSQTPTVDDKVTVHQPDVKRALLEQQVVELTEADVDNDRIESRTIYVKNLNFKTSEVDVKKHFTEHMKGGKLLSVRVKKHVKNGKNISMGFGFMEFDSVETAANVRGDLQGTVLDGHALILQLCHAKNDDLLPKKVANDRSSTKLIIRNVAFEATEKELRQLFSPFGQIKSLRLPRRLGNHRGFAFVEYVTKQEARNALEALSNTHFYGRHLVLERAKEGESLEELRARTAAQFTDSAKLSNKRKHETIIDEGNVRFEIVGDLN